MSQLSEPRSLPSVLESKLKALQEFIDRASADWSSVNPNEFHEAKEDLDRASMRLQEVGIAASLRNESDAPSDKP